MTQLLDKACFHNSEAVASANCKKPILHDLRENLKIAVYFLVIIYIDKPSVEGVKYLLSQLLCVTAAAPLTRGDSNH